MNTSWRTHLLIAGTCAALSCYVPEDTPGRPPQVEVPQTEALPVAPAPDSEPISEEQTGPERVTRLPAPERPNPPDTAGRLSDLEGSIWRAGEFEFEFKPGGHLIVRGGHFDTIAAAGVPGRVANRDGVLIFEILGRTSFGTWDGQAMSIDGVIAQRVQPIS